MRLVVLIIMLPFLIPIVFAAIFILKIFLKGKNEGWEGTILDKNHTSKPDDEHKNRREHFYSFKVKMTNGQERNIAVSGQFWNDCAVGDVIEKPKGAIFPKKVGKKVLNKLLFKEEII